MTTTDIYRELVDYLKSRGDSPIMLMEGILYQNSNWRKRVIAGRKESLEKALDEWTSRTEIPSKVVHNLKR